MCAHASFPIGAFSFGVTLAAAFKTARINVDVLERPEGLAGLKAVLILSEMR